MSYLSREASNLPEALWKLMDTEVVQSARHILTGRRFLHFFGPLGIGVDSIAVDAADDVMEEESGGLLVIKGRKYMQIPVLYNDFTLLARDLENAKQTGFPVDLSKVSASAATLALREDSLIYFGNTTLGYDGLLTVAGANVISRKDWSVGENAFADIAAGIEVLIEKHIYGAYALVVSPDVYMQMQRLQPGTGLLEIDRIGKLLDGKIYRSPVLGKGKAVLVCNNADNLDLVIGQDMAVAYLEQMELNHRFRTVESVLLRIKRPQAIVVFE